MGYKPMANLVNKDAYKKKEDIEKMIQKIDAENLPTEDVHSDSKPFQDAIAMLDENGGGLVSDDYHRGQLFPMIQNYLPQDMQLTKEEQVTIVKGVQKKLTGLTASVPITCYGDRCPFSSSCPLFKIGKAPSGQTCPIEAMVMDLYSKRYLDEFEVEAENFSEVTTMTMLAATHIMEMRGFMAIGRDEQGNSPDGIIKNVVGYTADEEPITQYQEHPGYAIIERAWKWRTKLLESLGATRQIKQKSGLAEDVNLVRSLAESNSALRSKIEKMTTIDISGTL